MSKPLKTVVLGMIHDHVWDNLPHFQACDQVNLVAGWDANAPLRERAAKEFGLAVYDDLDQLFDKESPYAAIIFSSNSGGAALAIEAMERGLDVMIEKPMASTLEEAERMLSASRTNDVRLMINWPFAWWPQLQHALRLAAEGAIGDVWQVRYRAAHQGPAELGCSKYFCDWLFDPAKNGGGALMDYCCYGANLARVVLGNPENVTGTKATLCKTHLAVEDNAMVVMHYPRAIAVAEGSWTQVGKLTSYLTVVYGTQGTLMVEPRLGGRLMLATESNPEGEEVSVPPPPSHLANPAEHFAGGIRTGEAFQPLCQAEVGRDVQAILEAAMAGQ